MNPTTSKIRKRIRMDERELAVHEYLKSLGIPFERFEHEAAFTMQDCEIYDEARSAMHCKNLFLTNRQGTVFYLLLMPGDKEFRTKSLSKELGISRLSFGSPEQLMARLGLLPGAVSPMGLINDSEACVNVLIDKALLEWDNIIVHPNINTSSITLNKTDLLKFLRERGNDIREVLLLEDTGQDGGTE